MGLKGKLKRKISGVATDLYPYTVADNVGYTPNSQDNVSGTVGYALDHQFGEGSVDVNFRGTLKYSGIADNLAIPSKSQLEINKIEANSVVVNQWNDSNAITVSNSDITSTYSNYHLTVSGTASAYFSRSLRLIDSGNMLKKDHKYCVLFLGNNTYNTSIFVNYNTTSSYFEFEETAIFTCSVAPENNWFIGVNVGSGEQVDIDAYVYLVDLTQWFGSNDLIPSDILTNPENFFKYYNGSLAYNTGTLTSTNLTSFDTTGVNLWDEETELGIRLSSKNYIRVSPNSEYYFYAESLSSAIECVRVSGYDTNKNFVGYINMNSMNESGWSRPNHSFTIPSNITFIKFELSEVYYGTTYNHDICINISNANINGHYYPYTKQTNAINFSGKSAGNAHDYIEKNGLKHTLVGTITIEASNIISTEVSESGGSCYHQFRAMQ